MPLSVRERELRTSDEALAVVRRRARDLRAKRVGVFGTALLVVASLVALGVRNTAAEHRLRVVDATSTTIASGMTPTTVATTVSETPPVSQPAAVTPTTAAASTTPPDCGRVNLDLVPPTDGLQVALAIQPTTARPGEAVALIITATNTSDHPIQHNRNHVQASFWVTDHDRVIWWDFYRPGAWSMEAVSPEETWGPGESKTFTTTWNQVVCDNRGDFDHRFKTTSLAAGQYEVHSAWNNGPPQMWASPSVTLTIAN